MNSSYKQKEWENNIAWSCPKNASASVGAQHCLPSILHSFLFLWSCLLVTTFLPPFVPYSLSDRVFLSLPSYHLSFLSLSLIVSSCHYLPTTFHSFLSLWSCLLVLSLIFSWLSVHQVVCAARPPWIWIKGILLKERNLTTHTYCQVLTLNSWFVLIDSTLSHTIMLHSILLYPWFIISVFIRSHKPLSTFVDQFIV